MWSLQSGAVRAWKQNRNSTHVVCVDALKWLFSQNKPASPFLDCELFKYLLILRGNHVDRNLNSSLEINRGFLKKKTVVFILYFWPCAPGNPHCAPINGQAHTCSRCANALLWKCVSLHLAASENVAVSGRTSTKGQLVWFMLIHPVSRGESYPPAIVCLLSQTVAPAKFLLWNWFWNWGKATSAIADTPAATCCSENILTSSPYFLTPLPTFNSARLPSWVLWWHDRTGMTIYFGYVSQLRLSWRS